MSKWGNLWAYMWLLSCILGIRLGIFRPLDLVQFLAHPDGEVRWAAAEALCPATKRP